MTELTEILGETPEMPSEAPQEAVEVAPEAPEAEVKGEETPAEETAPEESPSSEPQTVPVAALHGERERRQQAERELAEYRKQREQEQPKRPSVFEDEDAAFDTVQTQLSQGVTNMLLTEGKAEAINQYDAETVDAAEQWFVTEAIKSPTLASQLDGVSFLQQHRKVVELYRAEQSRQELVADPGAYEARLKQQGVEEYLAKQKAEQEKQAKLKGSIPKSLVGTESKGGITSQDWAGPTPLESVIGEGG